MDRSKFIIVFLSILSCCSCDINYEKKNKLVNGFIDFYNRLPNQIYTCDEGYLLNAQQSTEQNSYDIEVSLKVSEPHNLDSTKYLRCTGKVADLDNDGVAIMKHRCEEVAYDKGSEVEEIVVTETNIGVAETPFERKPIQLDNEIQTNTAVTSGEQFIAIPREKPIVHCMGCSSHVNTQAAGVSELASIGVHQLNLLEPNIKHTLNSVVDVERQVQVVRGIRYILTLIIDYNSCTEATPDTEICINSKACKVTVLEKPWIKLSDGSKYRAVLANNCTEEWRFGDDGVVIPRTPTDSKENNNINPPQIDGGSDLIKPIHNVDVQAQQKTEKTLTDEDIKVLEEQIIPHKQFEEHESVSSVTDTSELTETSDPGKEHLVKIESASQLSPNSIPVTNFVKLESLPEDKKKAIDDMLSFFNFAGFDSALPDEEKDRSKRSYDNDLNLMNLVDKFHKIKKRVDNAKYVYKLAQIVVDYLNEIDLEVKTRVLKEVINAEEEFENHQHFYYVQSRIIIPCDKSECEEKDTISKICNSVLDGTDKNVKILNVFCHDEPKAKPLGKVNTVALNDPVLLQLIKEATNKIESESAYGKAMKVNRIIDATTQRVSGTLTKFSIILDYTNCNKTVLPVLRSDCIVVEKMGSQVCDVTIHERHWYKQGKKITYVCIERPVDTSFSNIRTSEVKMSASDPAVLDMVNEALQYLDVQSNRNNKQVVVRINSVATQLVAGFLTDIEFVVGYTTCSNDVKNDTSKCKLLEDEPLRICKAKVWDRTWIEDGRQVDVSCKEPDSEDYEPKRLKDKFVGGPVSKDVTSPEIQQLAKDALREYLKASVYHRHYDVIDILEASVQVVAGTSTNLVFKISPTNCLTDREGNPSSSDCKVMDYNDVTTCSSVIWEKVWLDFKQINTTCHVNGNARVKRDKLEFVGGSKMKDPTDPQYIKLAEESITKRDVLHETYAGRKLLNAVGGETDKDIYDPEFKTLAKESLQKFLKTSGGSQHYGLISIQKATVQIVSGTKTKLEFSISPTNCQVDRDGNPSSSYCKVIDAGDVISCSSEIIEQKWRNRKDIIVTCHVDDLFNRVKRGVPGGMTEKDPNNPEYKKLAEESMHKYLQNNGNTKPHKVLNVNSVTTQVVAGKMTIIEFTISPADQTTGDVISCSSKIWEKPWENFKNIDVNCGIEQSRTKRDVLHETYAGRKLLNAVGGETDKDIYDPEFKTLAKESLQKFLKTSGGSQHYGLISIQKATVQIVSGTKTKLEFSISPTNCQVDHDGNPSSSYCKVIDAGDVISCSSEIIEQKWRNRKDIIVTCHVDDLFNRVKRGVPGGMTEKDPNNPEYKKLAEESMHKYLQNNGNTKPHKVLNVNSVTTQVVAGKMTIIEFTISPADQTTGDVISCSSKIWEKPWENFKNIDVNCGIEQSRTKRDVLHETYAGRKLLNAVGGETDKDIYDPEFKTLAKESLQKFLKTSGGSQHYGLISIQKATVQIVSGTKTKLEFSISPTNCQVDRDGNPSSSYCKVIDAGDVISCSSEIIEQKWRNRKDIIVTCHVDDLFNRVKRGVPGGMTEKDPNNPEYKKLAEESMHKYLQNNGNTKPHKVLNVNSVTTQVVAGKMTIIEFTISPADQTTGDVISCSSKIWEKPWENFKNIDVNCGIEQSRTKRDVLHETYAGRKLLNAVGGETDKDIYDPEFKTLAKESLQKFLKTSGGSQHYGLISIQKATVQIVSGTKTKLEFSISPTNCQVDHDGNPSSSYCKVIDAGDVISCSSEIIEQKWRNRKDIIVTCHVDDLFNRVKRGVPGGMTEKDPNNPEYKKLAEESMHKYLQNNGNTKPHKVLNVNSVTTQVVAGKMTIIEFTISPADQTTGDVISCSSKIWEKPWENFKNIDVNCGIEQSRTKRDVLHETYAGRKLLNAVGGETDKDIYDPEFKTLAKESLQKFLKTSGGSQHYGLISIQKATVQIVSGTKTKLEFSISPTNCQVDHDGNPSSSYCKVIDAGDVISCSSEIIEQKWRNRKDIDVTCHVDDLFNRVKRGIPGGMTEKDPNNPEYKKLAEESMHKYLQNNGNTKPHKLLTIISVTTQVVAGAKTIIKFTISPADQTTGDVISCLSNIWEKPWENFKNIDVNCGIEQSRIKRDTFHKLKNTSKGGEQEVDPTKNYYKVLAQDSLRKYFENNKKNNFHTVVEVKKVTKKVVSGIKYKIEYIAAPKACSEDISMCLDKKSVLHCKAEVWDRSWLGITEIDVICRANNNKKRETRAVELKDIEDTIVKEEHREKRQTDDYIDEEMSSYYADRAIKELNDKLNSNNLHKLVSIHGVQNSVHMNHPMVRMYIETVETYCLRHRDENILPECEELEGMTHLLCLVKLWPSPDNELVVEQVSLVCDDDDKFETVTGISVPSLIKAAIKELEKSPSVRYKLVHQGEPQVLPSLDSSFPLLINFIVASTNCSKHDTNFFDCFTDIARPSKSCTAQIWLKPHSPKINKITAKCNKNQSRKKRSISLNPSNATADELIIQSMVQESLHKLEIASSNRYKQRVLQINSYSTKITSGKVTTIDFDVGYTSCLKFEWVDDVKTCEFLEHLPRKHCVSQVWERLWLENGRNLEVTCEEDETPLESHVEFENAITAMQLANESLKYIDAKYPHPRKQKVVRIFSLEKQVVAGIHYRMKIEVGSTQCAALSAETDCKLDSTAGNNKFCRVNIWLRLWTDHPPNFRVTCDYQESASAELYHRLQAETLFSNFLVTYKPGYINNVDEMKKRFQIFSANIRKIHELNIHEKGTATYGVTRFTDLSYEEFTTKFLGLKPSLRDNNQVPMRQAEIPSLHIPQKFDWRDFDAVTEVKNQGSCGSCWAFSVTGNIEGQWKMQSGQLVSLSEQELVDCDKLDNGCNGGLPDNAYRAIEQLGGLELENDYPYEGEDDKCSFNKTMSRVKITGAVNITSNETDMAKWLVQNGPISIGINANAMQFYFGGVSHPMKFLCNPSNLDHGVLIVGYGVKDYPMFHKRLPYWTIKNSWGSSWGEQGYYRVYRGDGTCGVNMMASSAVI